MPLQRLPQKRQAWLMFSGLIAIIIAMAMLRKCSNSGLHEAVPSSGGDTIDVAIEYSPMSLYRYGDTLGGFNYDIVRSIAREHGLTIKFHPVSNISSSLTLIDDKIYDLLIAELPATADFKDRYELLEPVYLDRQVLVQRKDTNGIKMIKSPLDLASDTVWIAQGSPIMSRITNLAHEIGDTIFVNQDPDYGAEQLFILVATGGIRQAVINERLAKALVSEYPDVDISTNISFTQFQSWIAGKKRPELADSLNKWIVDFKSTPEYSDCVKRYF